MSDAFMREAARALPLEQPYDYHRTLKKGPVHRLRRAPAARPAQGEMAVPAEGWDVQIHAQAGPLVEFAAADVREYLNTSMQVFVAVERTESLDDWSTRTGVILAGVREDMPGIGDELKGSKDYEIRVTGDQIIVCGYDELGVMHGLFNLEARMSLREGPFLPQDLTTVRHSRYRARMVLSWLGWMQWPDSYLSHLAHDGYDAIFASVYANPNGVPGPPHYDLIRKQDAAKLNDVIQRAKRYGIKVYTPILYANTREPENKVGLREHVRDIVTAFPDIHGYILLTEGFYFEKFFGAGGHGKQDLRDWAQHWTEAVRITAEECHRINPEIEILPWEYNIDFRPQQVELKRHVTSLLPADTIPLLTWENGKAFEIDGLHGYLRDYSISQVGPAEVSEGQIAEAKRREMPVYCKVDCFATWQFGTTPYLPCPQQWQKRYDALAEHGINGTLETWSNGYKPNFIAELRAWSCWTNPIEFDALLRSFARREFGSGSEDLVLKAWDHFSRAIQFVPDTGPSMGTNAAVANPIFFDEPPARIMTLNNSWWDEARKTHWRHRMDPYWPYAHPVVVFTPDFTNRVNRAESYARARSGIGAIESPERLAETAVLPTFNKYLLLAADEFEAGLKLYRKAALSAPEAKRASAMKDVLIVEQMQRMLRSTHAILEFEDLRFRLVKMEDPVEAEPLLDRMATILTAEVERTEAALETSRRDSRLGYECEMDYVYTPYIIGEKLRVLHDILEQQLPAYRERHRQS
ncbi:MAG: hypothetical protein HN742_09430 [Lentisphaerae bacterium]|jgi:hypothetical protein|nr:hypothetical protein [Lentisphaerota bacterium]MBT5606711.1 hypothetical protein [Lentisphaerota bacterium]MBT7056986.1 hypothetical protein [Lentisphaerota bacterium]MBT7842083.1 hypothetical protein [Lentisphaerota bacterium]